MVSPEIPHDAGCHGCGRAMPKAKKIYKGQRYCGACYSRLFKRQMCPGCGNHARLPVKSLNPAQDDHCSACERAAPCFRCGKTGFEVALRSAYGPVCKVCVPYFRNPETCEVCGQLSQRIAVSSVTGLRSCQKCREPAKATCPSCRRHRVLVEDSDGEMQCKLCHEEGERSCPSCGNQMPAGRISECEPCYWTGLLSKRVEINLNGLNAVLGKAFLAFSLWLLERSGPHNAALSINAHYLFFRELEVTWGNVPSYERLLDHFGAAKLRRAENPMRWLEKSGYVHVCVASRENHTEKRRIEAVLAELEDGWSQKLLSGYHAVLLLRVNRQETDLRSVRLALRAATNFLRSARLAHEAKPAMKAVEAFWRNSPGQIAALTGFIGHLNRTCGLQLEAKPDKRWLQKAKKAKAERELVALLRDQCQGDFEVRWIAKALIYFHDLSRVNRKALAYRTERFDNTDGFSVEHGTSRLWVPAASSFLRSQELTKP